MACWEVAVEMEGQVGLVHELVKGQIEPVCGEVHSLSECKSVLFPLFPLDALTGWACLEPR